MYHELNSLTSWHKITLTVKINQSVEVDKVLFRLDIARSNRKFMIVQLKIRLKTIRENILFSYMLKDFTFLILYGLQFLKSENSLSLSSASLLLYIYI